MFSEYLTSGRAAIVNRVGRKKEFDLPDGEASGIARDSSAEDCAESTRRPRDDPDRVERYRRNARAAA